jgi:hypothetical protein
LRAYQDASKREFFTLRNRRTTHVQLAGTAKRENNNIAERSHGTFRGRQGHRGFQKEPANLLQLYKTSHELERKTPQKKLE